MDFLLLIVIWIKNLKSPQIYNKLINYKYNRLKAQKYNKNFSLKNKKYLISCDFKNKVGYKPNIENPKTFNEKLQWLKLYNEDELLTKCADKYLVRNYIAEKIGDSVLVPLLGVYDTPDKVDFENLPNQFVIKVNWGSGQNIIVKDKSKLNIEDAKTKLKKWLQPESNHYYYSFECSYKNIKPKIIIEKYIKGLAENLTCYKIFNFAGNPYLIQAVFDDKTPKETINYYDLEWNKLDLRQNFPNKSAPVEPPKHLNEMIDLARLLAKPFPYFVRTDFYELEDKVLFSEFTFFSDNGMAAFHPKTWDYVLGKMIKLPIKNN